MTMEERIVGLDVCKDRVVCCLLSEFDDEVTARDLYYELDYPEFPATKLGLEKLLNLSPTVAVLEPTGVHYAKIWVEKLREAGVEVRLVHNSRLPAFRQQLDLPDKDDQADALALALYYHRFKNQPPRFLKIRDVITQQVKAKVFELTALTRQGNPLVNRARQLLSWQFPEVAKVVSDVGVSGDAPLFWGWLAGLRESAKYERLYSQSCGLGIQDDLRFTAGVICQLKVREYEVELELRALLDHEQYRDYREVFAEFGFGCRVQAYLIGQIFPVTIFYGADGKPEIKVRKGKISGKPTTRYLSERRFMKAVGVAPQRDWSGDKRKSRKSGSGNCRTALWQWFFTAVEPKRARRTLINRELGEVFDGLVAGGTPVKLARGKCIAKGIRLLFGRLAKMGEKSLE